MLHRTLLRAAPAVLTLLVPFCGFAQEYRATVLGVVTDSSGANVADATVTVTNVETEIRSVGTSSAEGTYVVPFLQPGKYRLNIGHPGFKSFERSSIELRVNDRVRIDVTLEVGEASDRITFTADAPLLEAAGADRGQVVGTGALENQPVNAKNAWNMPGLSPGVQFTGGLTFFRRQDGTPRNISVNGGKTNANEYQVDDQPRTTSPILEAIQEMKIQTNTYDAQYGHTAGGIITVSEKSGTNTVHGAAYEYLRRTSLNANQYANDAVGLPRTPQSVDQYGFEADGPVILPKLYHGRGRTFFMLAYERYHEFEPAPVSGTVPTALEHQGDFSQSFNASGQLYTIYDPLTVRANPQFDPTKAISLTNLQYVRTSFAGNVVPQSRPPRS